MVKESFPTLHIYDKLLRKNAYSVFIYFFCCRDYCIILSEKLPSVALATSRKWKKRIS